MTINTELLLETADAIEYSDRFDLDVYSAVVVNGKVMPFATHVAPETLYNDCETVGCVAGWVCAIKEVKEREPGYVQWHHEAKQLLGLTRNQAEELFTPDRHVNANDTVWGMKNPYKATAKQAAKVLRGIAKGTRTFKCDAV